MKNHTTVATRATTAILLTGFLGLGLTGCGSSSGDGATSARTLSASKTPAGPASGEPSREPAQDRAADDEGTTSGDLTAFCDAADAIMGSASIDQSDPAAMAAQLNELVAKIDAVRPPAEIAEDWAAVSGMYVTLTDAVNMLMEDPASSEALTKTSEAVGLVGDEAFVDSATNIGMYAGTNCD